MIRHDYHGISCGCWTCCRLEAAAERRGEYIDLLLADAKWRAANKEAADEQNDGQFDGGHYSSVERALADLAEVPADNLIGSDALASVLRLAKVHGDERDARLREIAEAEYDRDVAA